MPESSAIISPNAFVLDTAEPNVRQGVPKVQLLASLPIVETKVLSDCASPREATRKIANIASGINLILIVLLLYVFVRFSLGW